MIFTLVRAVKYLQLLLDLFDLLIERSIINMINYIDLVKLFAPLMCFPSNGAFMSVKHKSNLPKIESLLIELIEHSSNYFNVINKNKNSYQNLLM